MLEIATNTSDKIHNYFNTCSLTQNMTYLEDQFIMDNLVGVHNAVTLAVCLERLVYTVQSFISCIFDKVFHDFHSFWIFPLQDDLVHDVRTS